jgi:hypothetical protein
MNGFAGDPGHEATGPRRFPAPGSGASAVNAAQSPVEHSTAASAHSPDTASAMDAAYAAIAATPAAGSTPYSHPVIPARSRRTRSWGRALIAALLLLVTGGALLAFTSENSSLSFGDAGSRSSGGGLGGYDSWSYYRQTNVDSDQYAPRWDTGFNEFSTASKWEYDGPYTYGGYGKAGMQSRERAAASGKTARDPLYTGSAANAGIDDVFAEYGAAGADPTSGRPVGADPTDLNPWYDPWAASWSNPYANRMRLAWGEASERDAWMQ